MATFAFLDPPKSDEQRLEESRRENDPSQQRFRAEFPGIVSLIFGAAVGFYIGFMILARWLVSLGAHP